MRKFVSKMKRKSKGLIRKGQLRSTRSLRSLSTRSYNSPFQSSAKNTKLLTNPYFLIFIFIMAYFLWDKITFGFKYVYNKIAMYFSRGGTQGGEYSCTYNSLWYDTQVTKLISAMGSPYGSTDENDIYDVFSKIKTQCDLDKLETSFGTQEYGLFSEHTLFSMLHSELSSSDFNTYVEVPLFTNGIII